MKAMILAAGLGTRLRPYTNFTPKPLFSIAGRPLLDIIIKNLIRAGCEAIIINTHHLHACIEAFLTAQNYTIPVYTRYEPEILGTGGAMKNVVDFWDPRPFIVVNGDILCDIDLAEVYDFHGRHGDPVTLVLCDHPGFNSVSVDQKGLVIGFGDPPASGSQPATTHLTFTGIQVINPELLDHIPTGRYFSSIEAFKKMMAAGRKIRAFVSKKDFWSDIGTPERYKAAATRKTMAAAFQQAFGDYRLKPIRRTELQGDGSTRNWCRLSSEPGTLIMVDHGIKTENEPTEVDSFVKIGNHLRAAGLPVPKIYYYDLFAGLVFLEDLGDLHLQTAVNACGDSNTVSSWYQTVISLLIQLSIRGAKGFDPAWTCQTPDYDQDLILEHECRYFLEAFVKGYLGWEVSADGLQSEFISLAENALAHPTIGFMHRDMQSRNIMIQDHQFYFIDFQGGRLGPIQYDLASLLIDPYVELPRYMQEQLLDYALEHLSSFATIDPAEFRHCFAYCSLTRNLQILGAFGYLSTIRGKSVFEKYIPAAVKTLRENLAALAPAQFPNLAALAERIAITVKITKEGAK
jgi:aminoglycoside/choline kinase family phosphotransferase